MKAPRAIALCQNVTGELEFHSGSWITSEKSLREAIDRYHEIGAASGEAIACQRLGALLTARGQLDDAMDILMRGFDVAEQAIMRAHCIARLSATMARNRLAANDLSTANKALELGFEMSHRQGNCSTCNLLVLPVAVSIYIAQKDFDSAEAICKRLDKQSIEFSTQVWLGMARQARGELAESLSDTETAISHYHAAFDSFQMADHAYNAACCQEALSRLYTQMGEHSQAQSAKTLSEQLFAKLGWTD